MPEVPEICRFLGIVVYILYDDHRPPHFHAEYGEWYELHRDDLLEDWQLAEQHQPLNRIPPLE